MYSNVEKLQIFRNPEKWLHKTRRKGVGEGEGEEVSQLVVGVSFSVTNTLASRQGGRRGKIS